MGGAELQSCVSDIFFIIIAIIITLKHSFCVRCHELFQLSFEKKVIILFTLFRPFRFPNNQSKCKLDLRFTVVSGGPEVFWWNEGCDLQSIFTADSVKNTIGLPSLILMYLYFLLLFSISFLDFFSWFVLQIDFFISSNSSFLVVIWSEINLFVPNGTRLLKGNGSPPSDNI